MAPDHANQIRVAGPVGFAAFSRPEMASEFEEVRITEGSSLRL